MTSSPLETSRAILYLLYEGRSVEDVLRLHPSLSRVDVAVAAGEGLRALEEAAHPRVESREERVARVRARFPRAFERWSPAEEERLRGLLEAGASQAAAGRALGRPPGAVARRRERWALEAAARLGDDRVPSGSG